MKKLAFISVVLLMIVMLVHGCQVDQALEMDDGPSTPSTYDPTPYEFDLPDYAPPMPKSPSDNPMTEEGVQLGRRLFYDKQLSGDNSMSCASCHHQSFGFTDSGNRYSTGVTGVQGDRNSMPLFNLQYGDRFFWDGRAASLEQQVLEPIEDHKELNENLTNAIQALQNDEPYPRMFYEAFGSEEITKEHLSKALAQFLRSIVSFRSKYDSIRQLNQGFFTEQELRGYDLFFSETGGDCFHCHTEANTLFSTMDFENNGLTEADDINDFPDPGLGPVTGSQDDYGKFKIPSLRNVELTGPYMHDGRFETLKEVLDFYSDSLKPSPTINNSNLKQTHIDAGGMQLTEQEKWDIIAFLKTLTDHSFVTDTSYQNPFN